MHAQGVEKKTLDQALIDRELLDYRRYKRFIRERTQLMIKKVKRKLHFSDEEFESYIFENEES